MEAVDGSLIISDDLYDTAPILIGIGSLFYGLALVISVLDSSQIRFLEIHNETNST